MSQFPESRGGYGGCRGCGRGGYVGRGRGPIICYNCCQQGHLARDFQLPTKVYCNYYKAKDHVIEECPHLITKWKPKGPPNNVLKISAEEREEQPTISIIIRSGVKTNVDATTPENMLVLEVRKARGPNPPFNP